MKFFAIIAAAAVAVASVNAADCDLIKIATVVRGEAGVACTTKSGFSFLTATKPSAEVLAKVCPVTECQTVLKEVAALGLGDCTVLNPPLQLETDLIKAFQTGCASLSGGAATTGGSGSGGASNSTVSTPAPAATTKAPSTSSAGSNSSSNSSTIATPAPTPASAASSVAVASGAVVLAVAASFL